MMLCDERHRKPCQILLLPAQLPHQDGDKGSTHETWFLLVELLLLVLIVPSLFAQRCKAAQTTVISGTCRIKKNEQ